MMVVLSSGQHVYTASAQPGDDRAMYAMIHVQSMSQLYSHI